jgi:hypothetical protein
VDRDASGRDEPDEDWSQTTIKETPMKATGLDHLRRRAARLDMRVEKSRARNPNALDLGGLALIDNETNAVVLGGGPLGVHSCTVEDISTYLDCVDVQLAKEHAP